MSENTGETNGAVPPEAPKAEVKHEPKKPKAEKKAKADEKLIKYDTGGKEAKKLVLPKDESDPHWDPRMELDVPEGLIQSMVDEQITSVVNVEEHEDGYHLVDGRTRVRAIPEVNRRRKKAGRPPFVLTLAVHEPSEDSVEGAKAIMLRGMRSNVRLDSPPTVLATEIQRWLSIDISEKEICDTLDMSVQTLHATLALLDLPKSVQKMVDDGTISRTAAIELTKLDEGQVKAAAEALAAANKLGKRVTSKDIARVSGKEEKVATRGQIKQWLLDSQSYKLAGKHGQQALMGCVVGIEMCLGTRSIDQMVAALDRIAKGENVRVDFKQYQLDGSKAPVKGQDKK